MGIDDRFLTVWRVAGTVHEVMAVLGDAEALSHLVSVYDKLGIGSKTELIRRTSELGL
jgi:hypothetical protein